MSYMEVAVRSGSPKAFRAAGSILNKNKNPDIPCHRVIRSDGKIGSYNKGVYKKEALLKREGVLINNRRVVL